GDRDDIILAIIAGSKSEIEDSLEVAGMVLTGGFAPHVKIRRLMKSCNFSILTSGNDTYTTTKRIHERRVKIRSTDENKVKETEKLVSQYVDIEGLVQRM
ncbi:unnamed protein product, partial [marine sediment metagenome]